MRDLTGTVDDRIPLLGDLPLVGRMFRSKLVDKRKANLLIFTTVRLVNPDGSPLREREVRGKPPFRL
jgi:general secretion pathway protein D